MASIRFWPRSKCRAGFRSERSRSASPARQTPPFLRLLSSLIAVRSCGKSCTNFVKPKRKRSAKLCSSLRQDGQDFFQDLQVLATYLVSPEIILSVLSKYFS